LSSEIDHQAQLEKIIQVFFKHLNSTLGLKIKQAEVTILFSNLNLLIELHASLIAALKRKDAEMPLALEDLDMTILELIAGILENSASSIQSYYCALAIIPKRATVPSFAQYLEVRYGPYDLLTLS